MESILCSPGGSCSAPSWALTLHNAVPQAHLPLQTHLEGRVVINWVLPMKRPCILPEATQWVRSSADSAKMLYLLPLWEPGWNTASPIFPGPQDRSLSPQSPGFTLPHLKKSPSNLNLTSLPGTRLDLPGNPHPWKAHFEILFIRLLMWEIKTVSLKLFRAAKNIYGNTILEDQIFIIE